MAPTPEEFERDFRRTNTPLVVRGLARTWPAARWTTAGIGRRCGDRTVSLMRTWNGRYGRADAVSFPLVQAQLGEWLDRLEHGEETDGYLTAPLDEWLPELLPEAPFPVYCRNARFRTSRVWIGPGRLSGPLHFDLSENLFGQLRGRKRFWLYPPSDAPWMASYPVLSGKPNFSQHDPEAPDYERFPQTRGLQPTEVVLEAGDVLYLPSMWWHHVRSLELSLSLNFWWAAGLLAVPVRTADLLIRLRRLEIYAEPDRVAA